jgi:hypothetical protein
VAALCRSYASHPEALEAVNSVLGSGVPGEDVLVLSGSPVRDAHREQVGEFGGTTEPGAPVGEFAGGAVPQGTSTGDFASEGAHRGGSFADTNREVITSYPDGVEQMHVTGHRRITRLLTDLGLDAATAKRDLETLHQGAVLVVVEVDDEGVDRVLALLER